MNTEQFDEECERVTKKLADALDGENTMIVLEVLSGFMAYSLGRLCSDAAEIDSFIEDAMPTIREDAIDAMNCSGMDTLQ